MKHDYIKPELEELEFAIEGSYLAAATTKPNPVNPDNPGVDVEDGDGEEF